MRKNKLLPVIHVVDVEQALENANIAMENGADGIFLINHQINARELLGVYQCIRRDFKEAWIGLNFLDLNPSQAMDSLPGDAQGLWVDNGGISQRADSFDVQIAKLIFSKWEERRTSPQIYFGGVAFKYQPEIHGYERAASEAAPFMDVITTSGVATGRAPGIAKLVEMRWGAPHKPIAIASGMTPENVTPFLDYVDYFLVATGISRTDVMLDSRRVRMMADKMGR